MLLPILDVVFVGLAGTDPGHVQTQLTQIFGDQKVVAKPAAAADVVALARQTTAAAGVVKKLGADGVIASEIVDNKGHHSLVIVVYDNTGDLVSMSETPYAGKKLAAGELAMIHDNLDEEIGRLVNKKSKPAAAKTATAPAVAAVDDDPLHASAAPVDAPAASTTTVAPKPAKSYGLTAGLGLGAIGRSFSPGPANVPGFDGSPVPSVRIDVGAEPIPGLALGLAFDRTLTMHTDVAGENASSSITRWEAFGGYHIALDKISVTPQLGLGRRVFNLETQNAAATPNGDYIYAMIGGTVAATVTPMVSVFGGLAFEPVVGGEDKIDMALGSASRWAFDVGAGVEVRPAAHVYVRGLLDYQRFAWSWDMTDGGGSDSYPSATVQVGARY